MTTNKKTVLLILALILILVVILVVQTFVEKDQRPPSPLPSGIGTETEEYKKAEQEYFKSTPVLQKLPANNPYFSIEYVNEQHLIVYPKIEEREQAYQAAREWFAYNGIDINNITIEYK